MSEPPITFEDLLVEIGRLHMISARQAARLAYYEQQERDRKPAPDAPDAARLIQEGVTEC